MVGLRRRVCRHDSRRAFTVGHCPHMYARIALTKTNATNAPARVRCPEVNKPKAAEPKNSTCITKRKSSGTGTAARGATKTPQTTAASSGAPMQRPNFQPLPHLIRLSASGRFQPNRKNRPRRFV